MRPPLLLLLGLLLLASPAFGDSWAPPQETETSSPDGGYVLVVTPRVTSFFEGLRTIGGMGGDQPSRGTLYRLEGAKRVLVWQAMLTNPWAPVDVLVADGGQHVVTLDNWHSLGYGDNVVAVHGPDGALVAKRSLAELIGEENLPRIQASVSSLWWRDDEWLDPAAGDLLLITKVGPRAVRLRDGAVREAGPADGLASLRDLFPQVPPAAVELAAGSPDATAQLVRVLEAAEAPLASRLRAAVALAERGDRRGAGLAREAVNSPEAPYALANLPKLLPPAEALPLLQQALVKGESATWRASLQGLTAAGEPAVEPLRALLRDRRGTADGRGGAALVLGDLKARQALPDLLDAVSDPDDYIGNAALGAVVEIAGAEAAPDLERILARRTPQDDGLARYFAAHRRPSVVPLLIAALEHARAHPAKSFLDDPVLELIDALQFQTGLDLGHDPRAWGRWLAAPEADRPWVLLDLGEPAGLLGLEGEELRRRLATTARRVGTLETRLEHVAFRPDGETLLSWEGRWLVVEDPRTGEVLGPPPLAWWSVHPSPDGTRFFGVEFEGERRLRDARSGEPLGPDLPEAAAGQVQMLDRARALFQDEDGVAAWDLVEGGELYRVAVPGAVGATAVGGVGAVWSGRRVTFFRTEDGRVLRTAELPRATGEPRLLTRDGRYLVLRAGALQVAGGAPVRLAEGLRDAAGSGSTVFRCPSPRKVQAISAATGKAVGPVFEHPAPISALSVSEDGWWLATGCEDGSVRVFNLARGVRHGLPIRLRSRGGVRGVTLRADGARLVVNGSAGLSVYDLRPDVVLPEDSAERLRVLRRWVGLE